jgi:6-phosphogluconolactonase (cycloisomerase 2 family)
METWEHAGEKHTRNMRIVDRPSGARHLIVAHQDSHALAVYRLCTASGKVGTQVARAVVSSAGNVCVLAL